MKRSGSKRQNQRHLTEVELIRYRNGMAPHDTERYIARHLQRCLSCARKHKLQSAALDNYHREEVSASERRMLRNLLSNSKLIATWQTAWENWPAWQLFPLPAVELPADIARHLRGQTSAGGIVWSLEILTTHLVLRVESWIKELHGIPLSLRVGPCLRKFTFTPSATADLSPLLAIIEFANDERLAIPPGSHGKITLFSPLSWAEFSQNPWA